jgi:hypothetical protein
MLAILSISSCGKKEHICQCKDLYRGDMLYEIQIEGKRRDSKTECAKYSNKTWMSPKGYLAFTHCELK